MTREKKALRRDEKEASLANRGAICGVVRKAQYGSRGRLPAMVESLKLGEQQGTPQGIDRTTYSVREVSMHVRVCPQDGAVFLVIVSMPIYQRP